MLRGEGRKEIKAFFSAKGSHAQHGCEGQQEAPRARSRGQGVPGLPSCFPRRRRPRWRTGPACARRPRRCPRWTPRPAAAPAAAGCGCGRGPRAARSGDLQGQAPAPAASSTRGSFITAQAGEGQTAELYSPGAGTRGEPFRDKERGCSLQTSAAKVLVLTVLAVYPQSVRNKTKFY